MITEAQLHKIIPFATDRRLMEFTIPLNDAMAEFQIDTPERQAAFLAQVAHESGSLCYLSEIASGIEYDNRADLGNTEPEAIAIAKSHDSTPGPFFKGHGLIQVTGYYNHKEAAKALGIDCLHCPDLLTRPIGAARSAAWFWSVHGLNELADLGTSQFEVITRRINGGINGLANRLAFYARANKVLLA